MSIRSPHLLLLLLPVVLTAGLLPACSDGAPPREPPGSGSGQDLLRRAPDERAEELGRLEPAADGGWVGWDRGGWAAAQDPDGIRMRSSSAHLGLPALGPGARALTLTLRSAASDDDAAGPELAVDVLLNGSWQGSAQPTPAMAPFTFETDAEAWRTGTNLLTLVARRANGAAEAPPDGDADAPRAVLGSVSYGEEHRVRAHPETGVLTLQDRAGVTYLVERPPAAEEGRDLFLSGEASGPGVLEVRYGRVDPTTGLRAEGESLVLRASTRDLARGVDVPVPAAETAVLAIDLRWIASAPGAAVTLRRALLRDPTVAELPNIVFVSIDTLSARQMSVYGYRRRTTPNLEAFAEEAVVFEQCRANAPWTVLSYASQLTGLYPDAHELAVETGDEPPKPWERVKIAPSRWTLAELLRARGYRTAGFVDNPWFREAFGYEQGFDHFDLSPTLRSLHDPEGGIRLVSQNALAWLGTRGEATQPFFLFAQALEPHAPYLPSEEFQGAFEGEPSPVPDVAVAVGVGHHQSFGYVPDHVARGMTQPAELPTEMNLRAVADAYDERILETDSVLGALFDELRARGLYEDAVIVVSADHGEALGGHGMYFAHAQLYDSVLRVPLLIRFPGGEHGGRRVTSLVQLVDLYPTLSELGGVPPRRFLHGVSLADPRAWDPPSTDTARRVAFAEGGVQEQTSLVAGRWKLIVSRSRRSELLVKLTHPRLPAGWLAEHSPETLENLPATAAAARAWIREHPELTRELSDLLAGPFVELYDLAVDPEERNDVSGEHPEVVKALLQALAEADAKTAQAREWARFDGAGVTLDSASLEEMESLGYTGK